MKIKNVTRGKNAGEVIELSAAEKAPLALQDGVINHQDFKDKYSVFCRGFAITALNFVSKGAALKGMWQNNIYTVEGKVTLHKRDLAKGYLLHPKEYSYKLKFEDTLDHQGLPDLKVTLLELSV